MAYPTSKTALRKYFKAFFEKGGAKAQRLYLAALASADEYASDYAYDEFDAALNGAYKGITDAYMEDDDELYYYLCEEVRGLAHRAKITFKF